MSCARQITSCFTFSSIPNEEKGGDNEEKGGDNEEKGENNEEKGGNEKEVTKRIEDNNEEKGVVLLGHFRRDVQDHSRGLLLLEVLVRTGQHVQDFA